MGVRFIGRKIQHGQSPIVAEKGFSQRRRALGRASLVGATMAAAVPTKMIAASLPAAAYNGQTAANYANVYALSYNPNYPADNDDCTDFVSQALHAGGQPIRIAGGTVNPTNVNNWWDF